MKPWLTITAIFMGYFLYGFYLSQNSLIVISSGLKKTESSSAEYYDYRGVTNVRTDLSNGSSSPAEVIAEAKAEGLDYLFFTDTNQFEEQPENLNSYNGNLLVMNAGEYSFLDSRLLYYNIHSEKRPDDPGLSSMYFTDLLSQKYAEEKDSLVVLSHPFRNGGTWTGSYPPGLDGIEIVNPKAISESAWNRSKLNVLWSFIIYPFNPRYAFLRLFREPSQEIALWDQLSKTRPTLAFGGSDASARAIPWANALLKFPSYQKSFEITSNHVLLSSELTGSYQKDRQKIFTALKRGNFYISLDLLGDPKGFIATMEDRDRKFLMGEQVHYSKNLKLKASLPSQPKDFYELIVFKNGERDLTVNTSEFSYNVPGPGIYRVVVRVSPFLPLPDGKKWVTWIYTNNFYVR